MTLRYWVSQHGAKPMYHALLERPKDNIIMNNSKLEALIKGFKLYYQEGQISTFTNDPPQYGRNLRPFTQQEENKFLKAVKGN